MSYILDALRRADSERERERTAVPGLHAQAVPAGAPDADLEARPRLWPWLIAAAFALLLGLVAWLLLDRTEPDVTVPASAAAPAASGLPTASSAPPAPAQATAATATTAAPAAAAPAAPPAVAAPASTATAAAPSIGAAVAPPARPPAAAARKPPAGDAAQASRKPAVAAEAAPATAAAKPGANSSAKAEPVAKASEAQGRVYALSELPEEIRKELPKPVIGGSIYSKSAANRMLVINGQVFHEGDELAPSLSLDQIGPKAAILKFKGFRYEITY